MKNLPFLALLLTFTGCASTGLSPIAEDVKIGRYDTIARPPNLSGTFDVIQPGQQPTRPVREIAVLTFDGGADDEAEALGGMVERARLIGADGLILGSAEAPNKGLAIAHPWFQGQGDRVFRARAFIYTP